MAETERAPQQQPASDQQPTPGQQNQLASNTPQGRPEAGDTRKKDENNQHNGGASGTGGVGGTGGSVL